MGYTIRVFHWMLPLVLSSFIWCWGYDVHRRINYKAAQIIEGSLVLLLVYLVYYLALFPPLEVFINHFHRN